MNVHEATKQRVAWAFDNFEKVYVCFSGGKDSTVMLHIVMEEAIKRNRDVGVLFIDLEGQYKKTISHIYKCKKMYEQYSQWFWVCLPIHLRNAVSVFEPYWKCWDENAKELWVREMPEDCICDENYFPFFQNGMEFEEFTPMFGEWYADGKDCACFVGIRSDESFNRYRAITNRQKIHKDCKSWTTKVEDHVYNIYPIYDWKTEDIWTFQGKNKGLPYNELYDYMYTAGLTIHQMRICQPYGDDQRRGLWLFHIIEPDTWAKVVRRVSGANSGAMYIREKGNINGYDKVSKPPNHTWESYANLLIDSMPNKTKEHYRSKITEYCTRWKGRGYPNGIPDEANYQMEKKRDVPSWRRVCKCILRNDYLCIGLGFAQEKSEAYGKYLRLVKRRNENE